MTRHTNSGHLPHMVEKCRKILRSCSMEMGRLPHTTQPTGWKAPKRSYNEIELLFDDEDSNSCGSNWLVPHKYLQSLRPKAGTPVQPKVAHLGYAWHEHG